MKLTQIAVDNPVFATMMMVAFVVTVPVASPVVAAAVVAATTVDATVALGLTVASIAL